MHAEFLVSKLITITSIGRTYGMLYNNATKAIKTLDVFEMLLHKLALQVKFSIAHLNLILI
jgi:hypothetical protein